MSRSISSITFAVAIGYRERRNAGRKNDKNNLEKLVAHYGHPDSSLGWY